MIVILGYNNEETEFINQVLEELGLKYQYSLLENDITAADKIILPHPNNLHATYRRMNLMNLFSLLRIIRTPILGINDGFRLMCNHLINKYKKGLGFFNFDVEFNENQPQENKMVTGKIELIRQTKLLNRSFINNEFLFYPENQPKLNDFTTVKIDAGERYYSLLYEYENYYALVAEIALNREIARNLISNFIQI